MIPIFLSPVESGLRQNVAQSNMRLFVHGWSDVGVYDFWFIIGQLRSQDYFLLGIDDPTGQRSPRRSISGNIFLHDIQVDRSRDNQRCLPSRLRNW